MNNVTLATEQDQLQLIYPSMTKSNCQVVYEYSIIYVKRMYCLSSDSTWGITWVNDCGFFLNNHYFMLTEDISIKDFVWKIKMGTLQYKRDYYISGVAPFKCALCLKSILTDLATKAIQYKEPIQPETETETPIVKEMNFWSKLKNKLKIFKKIMKIKFDKEGARHFLAYLIIGVGIAVVGIASAIYLNTVAFFTIAGVVLAALVFANIFTFSDDKELNNDASKNKEKQILND